MQMYVRGDGGLDSFPGYALKNKTALQQKFCAFFKIMKSVTDCDMIER